MRRKLGQHFLKNPAVARTMARALDISAGDTIIEIGPGQGQLTQALLGEVEKSARGTQIIAIEKDPALAAKTSARFNANPAVQIVEGNALKDIPGLVRDLKGKNYKLAGNIPYYITGKLLRLVGELDPRPEKCIFMVQKEVAERMASEPPRMNRLAATVQFWAEPKILLNVHRKEFSPPPEVDSAVILLETKNGVPPASSGSATAFYRTVRMLFAQPRKTVLNNLKSGLGEESLDPDQIGEELKRQGVNTRARPQDLDIESIKRVSIEFS